MRCKTCDYPLWNLKARQCPECGTPFRPSEFEFLPNSVRFCCPRCDQQYFGTSPLGHLVPPAFQCVNCQQQLEMEEMVLRPAEGVREEQTRQNRLPWLQIRERGWFKAMLATMGQSMVAPQRVMAGLPTVGAQGRAWGYMLLVTCLILSTALILPALIAVIMFTIFDNAANGIEFLSVCLYFFGFLLVGTVVYLALWGLVTHAMLRITGGAEHGLGRTYEALCFSAGAAAPCAFPILGVYPFFFVGWIWWLISAILMVGEGQRVRGGRATLATVAFPAVICLLGIGGLFTLTFVGMSAANRAMTVAVSVQMQQQEGQLLLDAALKYSEMNNGRWPANAVALVGQHRISGVDLIAVDTMTQTADVPIADTNLDELDQMPPREQQDLIARAVALQPPGLTAHRVGDFVFTYHGVDPVDGDPELWLLITSPDPDHNAYPAPDASVVVGKLSGQTEMIDVRDFAGRLAQQNDLRATTSLPPIPDPATITHAEPPAGQ